MSRFTGCGCPAPRPPVRERSTLARARAEAVSSIGSAGAVVDHGLRVRAMNGGPYWRMLYQRLGKTRLPGGDPVDASAVAATASAVIAVFALGFGFYQYFERRRQQLLIDLQGDKEAVAAVATRVRRGKLPWRKRDRRELLEAMCLATVFESSGRSRSLLYAALAKAMTRQESRKEIITNVEDITTVITRNSPYTDLARAHRRLFALRAALSINDDLRIRVERVDAYLTQPDDKKKLDERCTDGIHEWGALKKVLERRKNIVLVCPRRRADGDILGCPTIALDFHKTSRLPEKRAPKQAALGDRNSQPTHIQLQPPQTSRRERFRLTKTGQQLYSAKYKKNSNANLNLIADELAKVIADHPTYATIDVIVVVPGRKHDFSDQLGKEVARKASKLCVPITREITKVNIGPQLVLLDSNSVKGRDVIFWMMCIEQVTRCEVPLRFSGSGRTTSRIDGNMHCKFDSIACDNH